MSDQKTTYPHFNRPPKKYPQKDLHGRVRWVGISYKDFRRFQEFYINVFGYDMFELPESAGGKEKGSKTPGVCMASGPAQYDWEGLTPGHMIVCASHEESSDGILHPPVVSMEMHSDPDIDPSDTLQEIASHGGKVLFDNSKEPGIQPWARKFIIEDPNGNAINLWKCSASRTWDELETQRDEQK